MNHRRVESGAVWHCLYENLRRSFRPLLEAGLVQLHHNALAVTVPRSRVAGGQPLFEDEEPLAVIPYGVLFGRNDFRGRFHRWMFRLDSHFEEWASGRRLV